MRPVAPLTDPAIRELFREAFAEAAQGVAGFVVWRQRAFEWMASALRGKSQAWMAARMVEHIVSQGAIDQVRERRPEYASLYKYHYDFRLFLDGQHVYLETVLDVTRTGPIVTVVSMHPVEGGAA